MLDERRADESFEKIMDILEDDVLKAKTPDEKEKTVKLYLEWAKVYNERLKYQNDRYITEGKTQLELEKFEYEKDIQEVTADAERRARNREFILRAAVEGLKFGFAGFGTGIQIGEYKNSIIETNDISKAMTKGLGSFFGNLLTKH